MNSNIKIPFSIVLLVSITISACTKLDQSLNSALTNDQAANALGANGTALLLRTAYTNIGNPYSDMGNIFALEEVTGDQCLVPTRGGDWDDNGKWRSLHQHTWTVDGVDAILNQFNALNKMNFDATNVMAFTPTESQTAEARFIRALSLYQLFDLFGQFPFRNPKENLLNAPKVYFGDSAINFIISELNAALPLLSPTNPVYMANPDAVRMLLMKCYLNRGAFLNRAAPTFADADMQQVINLGNAIINSGRYAYTPNYFDNFSYDNGAKSREAIFAFRNSSGVTVNNSGIHNRWWPTLHYNQGLPGKIGGWNGFSTVAEFYNSFGVTSVPTQTLADSSLDQRIGGRFYKGATDISGLRPGLLVGQQYGDSALRVRLMDRKGNFLAYTPNIAPDLKETGNNLEITGIRAVKYVPDYSATGGGTPGDNYGDNKAGNWLMLFRYPEVVLMVAEAKMRAAVPDNAGALALVNGLRAARGAASVTNMPLVNTNNVYDPNTLLAERGRELYWEAVRRTDLIRFGVFTKAWAYKPASNPRYLLFPIPSAALAANPNLKQNTGY
ncbi:RagB/SusD family nutrient uptake outer membrane protein [Segetibacter sp. 3557_3]|uniref:RagB/SusD family nutrient uptake outer membrane protein n=1 Tax=Segetibacter sp. 3557_3 TaxID=2547429 RepID=UPI001058E629|nr:RagB/SusD family nutrient uptake outer membrane protein [Segetibacter sp. 3557_3]TDH24152.1 RagB/SusD family nutrient uptake outer membrane protein [Segetibacter sp. 3557_3]